VAHGDPLDFTGRVVLVTGGSRGIGRGIAETFLAAGADVMVCGRTEPAAPPAAEGRTAAFVAGDVREPDDVDRIVGATVERFGRLDVLVNNAGGGPPADSATASPRFNASIIALNLTAPFTCAQRANAVRQGQDDGGVIVNVASVSGIRATPRTAAYGAAKAGLIHLTKTLAVEYGRFGVRVNAVSPGAIATPATDAVLSAERKATLAAATPLQRPGRPEDIARAVLYFASPMSEYVTGQMLLVDGGVGSKFPLGGTGTHVSEAALPTG